MTGVLAFVSQAYPDSLSFSIILKWEHSVFLLQLREKTGAFRILTDSYVTSESGTGVVHQAPYFGEVTRGICHHQYFSFLGDIL